jgi:hypothetical protein
MSTKAWRRPWSCSVSGWRRSSDGPSASHLYLDARGSPVHSQLMDDRLVTVEQQLADLGDLKAATQRRHALPRDTPEWLAAVRDEAEIVERIRR